MSDLIQVSVDYLTIELLPEYDNEKTLEFLEDGAASSINLAYYNIDEAAKYVHFILYNRLWRHRKNEDGSFKYFKDGRFLQELYMPDLERKLGRWGRASIFDKFRGTKLGFNGLDLTPEEFDQVGGIDRLTALEDEISRNGRINSKTGEIIEYHGDTQGLPVKEFFRNLLFRLAPENTTEMSPAQVRDAIRTATSNRPNIWFEMIRVRIGPGDSGYETRWCREEVTEGILDHQNGLMSEVGIPPDVMVEYCKRLRTKNPLKVEGEDSQTVNVVKETASTSPGSV